ncbi:hypothetical protein [Dyella silvae]|uniref:hypothetical protein n=1 Tax=Dyella silvae TaxID=2994424 RepID=UPI00226562FB|nr:hypothetical protein [Dyella silvae]
MESSYRPTSADVAVSNASVQTASWPRTKRRPSQFFFASTMIGLGVLGLIYGDVAMVWQHIPIDHLPGQTLVAYAIALIELACGVGLLFESTASTSAVVLTVFLLLWVVLLKLPALLVAPAVELSWLGFGEIAVMLAGAWVLLATQRGNTSDGWLKYIAGERGMRHARVLFALSLPMIGLSHFVYSEQTAAFVPAWLPYRLGWAYLTGAGSIAACLGVLFGVLPRLAATLEAAMLWIITSLVWVPAIVATPTDRTTWTAFVISAAIACGAWVVADSYRTAPYAGRAADS